MNDTIELKKLVKDTYSQIAVQSKEQNAASCCGAGGCSTIDYAVFAEDYSKLSGYHQDADLGLGCGLPTEFAQIKPGDTVLDLGSGAGNDCFIARAITGETGKVIGLDMTPTMIEKARNNADALGFNNVEFRLGDIEHMPIGAEKVDVIVSNCVLNLVPNKELAFTEMFRVLKPGGHFSVSDIVLEGNLPDQLKHAAEMYAGCVSGAIQKADYLQQLADVGFVDLIIQKEKNINLPDDILSEYLSADEIVIFKSGTDAILSITLYGKKPEQSSCSCGNGSCC
ncbi:MAG: arsenite methyltransferase [Candidatus Kapaibacteriota bacterium]